MHIFQFSTRQTLLLLQECANLFYRFLSFIIIIYLTQFLIFHTNSFVIRRIQEYSKQAI